MKYKDEILRWIIKMDYKDGLQRWIIKMNYKRKYKGDVSHDKGSNCKNR